MVFRKRRTVKRRRPLDGKALYDYYSFTMTPSFWRLACWLLALVAGALPGVWALPVPAHTALVRAAPARQDFFLEYRGVWLAYLGFHTASP